MFMKKKRVVIAMSGGVDSSTAAALLKEEGHEVIGISMQLYNHAELKADYLATGHYVRNVFNEKEKCYELKKAKDLKKDQSYFLFGTDPKELPYLLFPLGDLEKTEVRTLAERHHLPTAQKPESMEICFIPNNNYSNFIESKIQNKKAFQGQIITKEGKILGKQDR